MTGLTPKAEGKLNNQALGNMSRGSWRNSRNEARDLKASRTLFSSLEKGVKGADFIME